MCSALQAHWEQQNTRHVSSLHHGLSSSQVCVDYQKKKKKKTMGIISNISKPGNFKSKTISMTAQHLRDWSFKYLPHLDESRKLTGILHQKTVGGCMLWKHESVNKATPHPVHHLSPWIDWLVVYSSQWRGNLLCWGKEERWRRKYKQSLRVLMSLPSHRSCGNYFWTVWEWSVTGNQRENLSSLWIEPEPDLCAWLEQSVTVKLSVTMCLSCSVMCCWPQHFA